MNPRLVTYRSVLRGLTPEQVKTAQDLAVANERLVPYWARRIVGKGCTDDILQDGYVALWCAAIKYENDKGSDFGTYASCCIKRQIVRSLQWAQRHGFTGLSRDEDSALSAMKRGGGYACPAQRPKSLDSVEYDPEGLGPRKYFKSIDVVDPCSLDEMQIVESDDFMDRVAKVLRPQEYDVVYRIVVMEQRLCEVAADYGVSKEWIRQLKNLSLEKIRRRLLKTT